MYFSAQKCSMYRLLGICFTFCHIFILASPQTLDVFKIAVSRPMYMTEMSIFLHVFTQNLLYKFNIIFTINFLTFNTYNYSFLLPKHFWRKIKMGQGAVAPSQPSNQNVLYTSGSYHKAKRSTLSIRNKV